MKPLVFALALAIAGPFAFAGADLVFDGSFDIPAVTHRTPKSDGGDVSKQGENPAWVVFQDAPAAANAGAPGGLPKGNSLVGGVTNEVAHSGSQSLFIQADNLTTPYAEVKLISRSINIDPDQNYSISIWGRNDVRHPMTGESQRLFFKLKVDFYTGDGSQTGDSQYLFMPIPGVRGRKPLFVDTEWRRIGKAVTAPSDAKSMILTWKWDCSPGTLAANGVMYFDDVTVVHTAKSDPEEAGSPEPAPTPNVSETSGSQTAK